jgi:CheY-like chemotaxis protein
LFYSASLIHRTEASNNSNQAMARILVIEDELPVRENLVRFLKLEGHQVSEAPDGAAGVARASLELPDMILCDVMMPNMNGFEALAALQADPRLRHIPLVFLSASAEPERMAEAVGMGARGYITKPFSLADVKSALDRHLS